MIEIYILHIKIFMIFIIIDIPKVFLEYFYGKKIQNYNYIY